MARNRFSRINQPVKCRACGKLTTDNAGGGTGLCAHCYRLGGLENEHSDGHHDGNPHADCPDCKSEPEPNVGTSGMHEPEDY